jgi:deoxyribodipyrimidine photolyase
MLTIYSYQRHGNNLGVWQPADQISLRSAAPLSRFKGGTAEGMRLLRRFINGRLPDYETARNQPQIAGTSELSA